MTSEEVKNITLESLRDWFKKEKWVRISSSGNIAGPCGTSKNKKNPDRCLPKAKAQSLTKGQRAATAAKKKKAGAKGKTVVKNTKKATVKKEGLWANINAKKKAGKKSSHKNSNAYKDAKKAGNALKQETKGAPAGHYFTASGNLVKGRLTKDAKERGARLSDPKDKQRSKVPPVSQYNETADPQDGKAAPYGSGYKPIKNEVKGLGIRAVDEFSSTLADQILNFFKKHEVLRKEPYQTKYKSGLSDEDYVAKTKTFYLGAIINATRKKVMADKTITKEDIKNFVIGTIAEMQNENTITEKDDRCTRLAKQKYDTWPSAYASGAVVRCRRGEIWKKK